MNIDFSLLQVTEHTVMGNHEDGHSNAGAVLLNDFIVAIDCTMWPHTARLFRQGLEEKYRKPVKYLFVTHSHGDHVMGLTAYKDITIFGNDQLQNSILHRLKTQWTPEQMAERKAANPDESVSIDEVEFIVPPLLFHDRMEIVNENQKIDFHHSGGHTEDSSWAYFAADKVLFAGDLIFSSWFPYAGDESCNPEKWIDVLTLWMTMPINKVIPGHGPVMGLEIVDKTLRLFEQLKQNTLKVISEKGSPEQIIIPDIFELTDDIQWIIERTRTRWFNFYAENTN